MNKKIIINIGCYTRPNEYAQKHLDDENYFIYLIDAYEPILQIMKEKVKDKKNVACLNECIDISNSKKNFYFDTDPIPCEDGFCSHGTLNPNYWYEQGHKDQFLDLREISTITFDELIKKYDISNDIELLAIDCETLDCDIIKSIDFSKYNIKVVIFEVSHSEGTNKSNGPRMKSTVEYLHNSGYSCFKRSQYDYANLICAKNEIDLNIYR